MFRNQAPVNNGTRGPGLLRAPGNRNAPMGSYHQQSQRSRLANRGAGGPKGRGMGDTMGRGMGGTMGRGTGDTVGRGTSSYFAGSSRGARPAPYSATRGNPYQGSAYGYGSSTTQGGGDRVNQASTMTDQFIRVRTSKPESNQSCSNRSPYFDKYPASGRNMTKTSINYLFDIDETIDDPFEPFELPIPHPTILTHSASKPAFKGAATNSKAKIKSQEEPSLRVISVTPTTFKQLNYKNRCANILFEVFGSLCTAVTKRAQSAMHFCLNSQSDIMSCVFYEIDRPLGNMTRQELYRCVGTYKVDQHYMQFYSVRLATSAEKKHLPKLLNLAHEQ